MMITLSATNKKVKKRTLQLLAKADRQLQQERKFHQSQGRAFQPSAVQQENERLWAEAKSAFPDAAAEAEADEDKPGRRERFSDIFKTQLEMQQKLVQQYTQPNNVETALMSMLASFTNANAAAQPAEALPSTPTLLSKKQRLTELKELLEDNTITQEEYEYTRKHILTS
jgi:hypothetical protein